MNPFHLPQLPAMQCDDGCGDCCTIVPVPKSEFRRIAAVVKARGIKPVKQGITCPLFIDGKCSIYEARPALCRLFGHCESMVCTRGYNANTTKRTERQYQQAMISPRGNRHVLIHDLVHGEGELDEVIAAAKGGA